METDITKYNRDMGKETNNVLEHLKRCDAKLYGKIVQTLKLYKGIDFENIAEEDVMVVSPDEALKYAGDEGDKYFKVWIAGDKIAWCTWANTLVDSKFRWNTKSHGENKRDNGDLLGNEPYVSAYLKSYDAAEKCNTVYMFPFAAFGRRSKEEALKKEEATTADKWKDSKAVIVINAIKSLFSDTEEEKAKQQEKEIIEKMATEKEQKEIKKILDMQMDDSDPQMLVKELLKLGAKIDAIPISDFFSNNVGAALRGMFNSGLVKLKILDPQNPIIGEMMKMQQKWKIKMMLPFLFYGGFVCLLILLMLIEKLTK